MSLTANCSACGMVANGPEWHGLHNNKKLHRLSHRVGACDLRSISCTCNAMKCRSRQYMQTCNCSSRHCSLSSDGFIVPTFCETYAEIKEDRPSRISRTAARCLPIFAWTDRLPMPSLLPISRYDIPSTANWTSCTVPDRSAAA